MGLFDAVALVDPLPGEGLARGSVGTIVHIFDEPRRAYEVEFVNGEGKTVASVALLPEQIQRC